MQSLEKTITAIIILIFVFLILFVEYENINQVYDCTQLHRHNVVPNEVVEECFKISKPTSIIST
jgi:hypothetical protein